MKSVVCKFCKKPGHYKYVCLEYHKTKPRGRTTTIKPLSERLGKQYAADRETKLNWIQKHGGVHATWQCYLRISPRCLRFLNVETLTADHVIPKGRGIKYRHDISNIQPACLFCNQEKGSRTIEALAVKWPHLLPYVR